MAEPATRVSAPASVIDRMFSAFTPPSISKRITCPLFLISARACRSLSNARGIKRLTTKTRIYRHDQNHVQLVHHMLSQAQRGSRIEHQTCATALVADQLKGSINVITRLRVECDVGGAGRGEHRDQTIDRLDHQVDIDGGADAKVSKGLTHYRTNREVGGRNDYPSRQNVPCPRPPSGRRLPPGPSGQNPPIGSKGQSDIRSLAFITSGSSFFIHQWPSWLFIGAGTAGSNLDWRGCGVPTTDTTYPCRDSTTRS